ncbi:MAG: lamin tail domain-containing protein [Bacteroidales bacterium]|nr:lamin tail domain-containing protein [Bacteroidales bacterium]
MRKILKIILGIVVGLWLGNQGFAQVNISAGTTIIENFDNIGTTATLPSAWKADKNTTVSKVGTYSGAGTATEQSAGNSMSPYATNGIYNFGAGAEGTATDRAVGGISSGSASKSVNIYVQLKNNGGTDINSFTISYNVEKYRNGSNAKGFSIQMYYSTDGSNWTSAGTDFLTSFTADTNNDGFTSAPGETKAVSSKTLNQSVTAGNILYLAWNYSVSSGSTTSNAQALGIDDVSITANGSASPSITVSPTTLTGFTYIEGYGPSDEQTFTVSGSNLTANISLTAPTNYEISKTSGSGYAGSLTLTPNSGTVSSTTIYVRLKAGLSAGNYNNENITASSTGATSKTVSCSGTVTAPFIGCATDLIISEYVEGSSSNKYIEIFNGTNSSIDLSDYKLRLFANGAISPTNDVALSGSLSPGSTIVYKNSGANLTLPTGVVATNNVACNFNGDDAIALYKTSTSAYVDIFGRIGEDPGTAWTASGGYTTLNKTLRRKANVTSGVTVNPASGFPTLATEWDMFNEDDANDLGSHTMNCGPKIVINLSTLSNFDYFLGSGPSEEQTILVSGSNLTANISLTAPTNYEISTSSGSGFTNTINLSQTDGIVSGTTIYVRLKSGLSLGDYNNENITASSTGADSKTVTCNGRVNLAPVTGLSIICSSNTTAEISWASPDSEYDGVVIAFRQSNNSPHSLSANPTSITVNPAFGSGHEFGNSEPKSYVVYKGTGNSVEVTNLTAGETYRVKAYVYKGTTWIPDNQCPTMTISNLGLSNVNLAQNADGDSQSDLAWVLPSAACFDEVLVVAKHNTTITYTPTGDASGFTASPIFGSGSDLGSDQYVVYKGTGTNFTITGLTNGQTYFAKIFVRKGTDWSSGVELELNPKISTVLEHGDLAILAVNTSSAFGDEISFVSFKNIVPETSIDFTDNGYEREYAGMWGSTEGTVRITRINSVLEAGTVVTFEITGNAASIPFGTNLNIYVNGSIDNTNWTAEKLGGSNSFDLNSDDQLWIMQNGNWVNPSTAHTASYSGNVLYGWTATGWKSAHGYKDTKGSTIFPGCECANTNVAGLANKSKVKYTGSFDPANKFEWIARINNPENWTGWADNEDFDTANPNYKNGISLTITPPDAIEHKWMGYKSSGWCDCSNWYNLRVPTENTDVEISPHDNNRYDLRISAHPDSIALCKNLIVKGDVFNSDNASLKVKGDFKFNGGSVNFDLNTINIEIGGDLSIDNLSNFKVSKADINLNGSGIQNINANTDIVFSNLIINKSGGYVNLEKNIEVTNLNLLNGKITTGAYRVFVNNSAINTITNASNSSYINGNLRRKVNSTGEYIFPVGNASNYELAKVKLNSSTGLTYLDARFDSHNTNLNISSLNLSVNGTTLQTLLDAGYWTILPNSGSSGIKYDIGLEMRGALNIGSDPGQHTVVKRNNSSSNWYLDGGHHNSTQTIVGNVVYAKRTGLTSFSEFSIAKHNEYILPVELVEFKANCNNDFVKLKWTTASETNSDYFQLQKSQNAINWKNIDKIQAAGFSNNKINYEAKDKSYGNVYYRLIQVDFDGTYAFSNIISVNCIDKFENPQISIYPNPFNDVLSFNFENINSENVKIEILDLMGKLIRIDYLENLNENSNYYIDLKELKPAIYFVKIQLENEILIRKIEKIK